MDTDPFDLVGDTLDGQFRVDAFAGEGDLSVVYRGHHLGLDASIAIKCLNLPATLDVALVQPLINGFKEASRMHYRLARGNLNIAQSIASGETIAPRTGASVPYLVREWFDGQSLASDLARRREEKKTGRTPEEAVALLQPAFDGVAFAHREGVAHLGLNPGNLFAARSGDGASLKVLDFGVTGTLKELVSGSPSGGGLRVLNPAYAAPEQFDKKVGSLGPWTDVYALALVMLECLSDRIVMAESETGALVERALDAKRRPTPRAHGLRLPSLLDQCLTRAVALAPHQRQKSAADLWKDITAATQPPERRAAALPIPSPPPRPRSPTLMGGVGFPVPSVAGATGISAKLGSSPSMATKPMSFEAASPTPPLPPAQPVVAPVFEPVASESPVVVPTVDVPDVVDVSATAVLESDDPPRKQPPFLEVPPTPTASDFVLTAEALPIPRPWWRVDWRARLVVLRKLPPHALTSGAAAVGAALLVTGGSLLLRSPEPLAFGASNAARHPPPPPEPETPVVESPPPAPPPPFVVSTAWRALYATSRQVADCRRGNVWGATTATVTFGNDGSVTRVAFRKPFTGSTTAACAAEILSTVRTEPFAGQPGVVDFWFYVSNRSH
jgi:serine/threonine protein kinase